MVKFLKLMASLMILVIASNLTGCGSKIGVSPENNKKEIIKDVADRQKKEVILKLWHIWGSESDSNKEPFEKVLRDWNKSNPGIKIVDDATEAEFYKSKIRTAIAVNEAPDIFYSWGAGFAKPFVDAGKVLPLDDYLNDGTKERLLPGSLDNFTYDGKIYALPVYMTAVVFYMNKDIFNKNSIKMPDTFDELLAAVSTLRKAGITPMVVGEKDRWPGMFYQNILAIRTAGTKMSNQALKKEISFEHSEFAESAEKLKELIDAGAFDSRCMRLTAHEAEMEFINGKAAMYYNGSWSAGSLEKEGSLVKGKLVVKNFPVLGKSGGDKDGFLGGAIDTFMISSSTQHKEEAIKALKSLDESFCRESYISGASQPAWKLDVDEGSLNPLTVEISKLLKDNKGFVLAWDTFLEGQDAELHKDLVAEIFAGSKTPKEFIHEMQKLNEKPVTGN